MNYYLDENHNPIAEPDILKWAERFEAMDRRVARTVINDVAISTVFLSVDHNFGGGGRPVLFETMIFGGEHDEEMERHETWEQAEAGHKQWVDKLRGVKNEK